jgi:hypothetical protein
MSKLFLVNIDMHGNEIQNVVLQPLATAPSNPTVGRIYYDTTESMLKTYDGTRWSSVGAVVSVNGQAGAVVLTQDDVGDGSTYVRTHNDLTDTLLNLINGALQKSGGTMSGAIAMGNHKITGLANGTAATDAAAFGQIPVATTTSPKMNGTAAVGSETKWAKGDHVHPTDTSRQAKITASGILKGNGSGGVSAAVAGTDYAAPSAIPTAYTSNPAMDGTASAGSSTSWAKGDHVHPTDTSRMAASLKGAANGVAELDANGKVPSSQLPSYVDDVIEGYYHNSKFYKEAAHTTEITGESGKIYVDLSSEKTYRWSGSAYAEISSSLALGETSSTAYRGDRGKTAYDHSQLTSGNPHNVTKSNVGLGNVDNTSDATKKTNFTGSIASGNTGFVTGGDVYSALANKSQVLIAQGSISTSSTSCEVSIPTDATVISAYATMSSHKVETEIEYGDGGVVFTIASTPSSTIYCDVFYVIV